MAGKNNAKPAEQAKPAKDAAMAEAINGAAEQAITPPVQAGNVEEEKAPGTPAKLVLKVDGLETVFDVTVEFPEPKGNQGGKVFCLPPVLTVEGAATCDTDELKQFMAGIDEMFAGILAEAGVLVRKSGKEVPPTGEDILAISMKDEGTVVVTKDGRKFWLVNNGAINEAQ